MAEGVNAGECNSLAELKFFQMIRTFIAKAPVWLEPVRKSLRKQGEGPLVYQSYGEQPTQTMRETPSFWSTGDVCCSAAVPRRARYTQV